MGKWCALSKCSWIYSVNMSSIWLFVYFPSFIDNNNELCVSISLYQHHFYCGQIIVYQQDQIPFWFSRTNLIFDAQCENIFISLTCAINYSSLEDTASFCCKKKIIIIIIKRLSTHGVEGVRQIILALAVLTTWHP